VEHGRARVARTRPAMEHGARSEVLAALAMRLNASRGA
jgi:hypothetical protein